MLQKEEKSKSKWVWKKVAKGYHNQIQNEFVVQTENNQNVRRNLIGLNNINDSAQQSSDFDMKLQEETNIYQEFDRNESK